MASRKHRSPEGLKAEITSLIKQRDAIIEKLARDFASALYAEGIAVKLSGYGKRDLRRIAQFMSEDIDRYIERLEEERKVLSEKGREAAKRRKPKEKKPYVNPFSIPFTEEELAEILKRYPNAWTPISEDDSMDDEDETLDDEDIVE